MQWNLVEISRRGQGQLNVFVLSILQRKCFPGRKVSPAVAELQGGPIHFHPDLVVFAVGLLIGGSVRENIVKGLGIADLPEPRQEVVVVGEKDAPSLLAQLFQRAALISLVPEETGKFPARVQARIEVLLADWLTGQVSGLFIVSGLEADGVKSSNVHHVDGHPGAQSPAHHLVQPPAHGARRNESVGKKHQGFAGRKMLQGLEMVAQGGDQPLDGRLGSRILVKGFGSHVLFDVARARSCGPMQWVASLKARVKSIPRCPSTIRTACTSVMTGQRLR